MNNVDKKPVKIWVIIPAAGVGSRMNSPIPKQYLPLCGSTVLETTLNKLLSVDQVEDIIVAINESDSYWHELPLAKSSRITTVIGGAERCDSVLNAIRQVQLTLASSESATDWVLVHDAARPCVSADAVERLIDAALANGSGGILATPTVDTIKQATPDQHIACTRDRKLLWHAHTPQMFRLENLVAALQYCKDNALSVTDEASAIEHYGGRVALVDDRRDNIKITCPEDLAWAEFILGQQNTMA